EITAVFRNGGTGDPQGGLSKVARVMPSPVEDDVGGLAHRPPRGAPLFRRVWIGGRGGRAPPAPVLGGAASPPPPAQPHYCHAFATKIGNHFTAPGRCRSGQWFSPPARLQAQQMPISLTRSFTNIQC